LGQLGQYLLRPALQVVHGLPDLALARRVGPPGHQQAEQSAGESASADPCHYQEADAALLVTVGH